MNSKFHLNVPFTSYYGLLQAIPPTWKRWIQDIHDGQKFQNTYDTLVKIKSVSKPCYFKLNENSGLYTQIYHRWEEHPQLQLSIRKIEKAIKRIYCITNIPKLRSFQYRMLLKSTITNVQLKRFGIKDSDYCTFCKQTPEMLLHLFYECEWSSKIWQKIERLCFPNQNPDRHFTFENILLVDIMPNAKFLQNLLVLLTKYFIYRSKCENTKPTYAHLINYIYLMKDLELTIAKRNKKMHIHDLKWALLNTK